MVYMKNKTIIALGIIVFILIFSNVVALKQKERYKKESNRLSQSLGAEMKEKQDFIFRDSLNASRIEVLQLTNKELNEYRKKDAELIKELSIRKKDVEVIGTVKTEIKIKEVLVFKDSCFSYNDGWNQASFCLNTKEMNLQVKDSIGIILHNIPKKFWFIKYGSKGVNATLIPFNPKSKISHAKFVKLKK